MIKSAAKCACSNSLICQRWGPVRQAQRWFSGLSVLQRRSDRRGHDRHGGVL